MNSGRIPFKADMRKIRLFGFTLMILALCSANAFALDIMGPPTAEIEQGKFRAGIDYSSDQLRPEYIRNVILNSMYAVEAFSTSLFEVMSGSKSALEAFKEVDEEMDEG